MLELSQLPPVMQTKNISALAEAWEGILFLGQSESDQKWRVWACFGESVQVLAGPFPTEDHAIPFYLAHMVWVKDCARHFYELGQQSIRPVPPEPGMKPTLTLV